MEARGIKIRRLLMVLMDYCTNLTLGQLHVVLRSVKEEWKIEKHVYLLQGNFYNCGPFVCLALINMFLPGKLKDEKRVPANYRPIVINLFREMLKLFDKELAIRVPSDTVELQDSSSEDKRFKDSSIPSDHCPAYLSLCSKNNPRR